MTYACISGHITHIPIEHLGIYEKIAGVVKNGDEFHKDIFHNDISKVENSSLVIADLLEKEFSDMAII